jgi:rare lipoprotein A
VLGNGRALVEVETIMPDAQIATRTPSISSEREAGSGGKAGLATNPTPAPEMPATLAATATAGSQGTGEGSEDAARPQSLPVVIDASGVYLQLGAFGSQDNADNYLARLRALIEWLAPALHVYPKNGLFRVHAGPYANRVDARAAADRISQTLGIKALVLLR